MTDQPSGHTGNRSRAFAIERFSIGDVVSWVFILLGVVALLQSLFAGSLYRDKAMEAETRTVRAVIAVAARSIMSDLKDWGMDFGMNMANQPVFSRLLAAGPAAEPELTVRLDDPLINGFPNNERIALEQLRLYRLDGTLAAQSSRGLSGLPAQMDSDLGHLVWPRNGLERLQAVSGIWMTPAGPRFSIVVPVGGLRIAGYLEVVTDPQFNLPGLEQKIQMPVKVTIADLPPAGPPRQLLAADHLSVDYLPPALDGRPAYRMTAKLSVSEFNADIHRTVMMLFLTHLLVAGTALLLAYAVLMRFLITPVHTMCANIDQALNTKALPPVCTRGLDEFHRLASLFNRLMVDVHHHRAELENLTLTDELTRLANRRAFNLVMDREWKRACRHHQPLALLLIDIDYFKKYNDHYGHQAGDQVLQQVAFVLQQMACRSEDLAVRYGGEEFAVILASTHEEAAMTMAQRITQGVFNLGILHQASEVSDRITLSIGVVSCVPVDPGGVSAFIEHADRALYLAKGQGRNQVHMRSREELHACSQALEEAKSGTDLV